MFSAIPRVAFGPAAAPTGSPRGGVADGPPTPARVRAARRRQYAAQLAAELLPELPEPGESVHTLMGGHYDLGQVVCAVLDRHPVSHLRVATLAYSRRTVAEITERMDAHGGGVPRLGRLTLLVSGFFERHNADLFAWVTDRLAERPGSRHASARSHAKVVLFEFADGSEPLAFEGSANLRKNGDREQLTAIRDRALHDWHAAWIDDLASHPGAEA